MNRSSAQSAALLLGAVLVAFGILGFVPAITIQTGSGISFAGHGSSAWLIGEFQVSILLNIVYILLGGVGLWLVTSSSGAYLFLLGGGLACLVLWLLGIGKVGKWIPVNAADDWLNLGLGAGLVGLAFATSGSLRAETA
jgi:hypothetical protein